MYPVRLPFGHIFIFLGLLHKKGELNGKAVQRANERIFQFFYYVIMGGANYEILKTFILEISTLYPAYIPNFNLWPI